MATASRSEPQGKQRLRPLFFGNHEAEEGHCSPSAEDVRHDDGLRPDGIDDSEGDMVNEEEAHQQQAQQDAEEEAADAEDQWAQREAEAEQPTKAAAAEPHILKITRRCRAELMAQRRRRRTQTKQTRSTARKHAEKAGWRSSLANMEGMTEHDPEPAVWAELVVQPHPTHQIRYTGGIWCCFVCGGTHAGTSSRQGRLPDPCSRQPPSGGSRSRLRKLEQGRLPATHAVWPDSRGGRDRRLVRRAKQSEAGRREAG